MVTDRERPYDLIVFGATSFVGQILCAYLRDRIGSDGPVKWAIAGRNPEKLNTVADEIGITVDHVVADADDPEALEALANETRVIVSTVGPYALYGSRVVEAAVAAGTDYCDLSGEPHWMQDMIDSHHVAATRSGSRVVHSCGFDSVPSDLGVLFTQQKSRELLGEDCHQIAMRVKVLKGAPSGGTVASMLNTIEATAADPAMRRVLANPYALAPEGMRTGVRQPNIALPVRDEISGRWVAPFVMASVNTRIVHRSHALLGRPWGESFTYDEAMMTGVGPLGVAKATALSGGLASFLVAASVKPVRSLLANHLLPKPGDGPSPEAQAAGSFDLRFYGTTPSGTTIHTKVTGDRDPGYGSTAKMLGEAALALIELDPADKPGGFWTPATAFGNILIDRLVEYAGLSFELVD